MGVERSADETEPSGLSCAAGCGQSNSTQCTNEGKYEIPVLTVPTVAFYSLAAQSLYSASCRRPPCPMYLRSLASARSLSQERDHVFEMHRLRPFELRDSSKIDRIYSPCGIPLMGLVLGTTRRLPTKVMTLVISHDYDYTTDFGLDAFNFVD